MFGRSKSGLKERTQPARDRAAAAAKEARLRAAEASAVARERAIDAAEIARERAQEYEPAVEQVRSSIGTATRKTVAAASTLPAVLSKILELAASLLGSAAESGRAMAARVEPPAAVRRRRRAMSLAWFAGGFAVGAAAGWFAHERMASEGEGEDDPELPIRPAARDGSYPREVDAIDARRSATAS